MGGRAAGGAAFRDVTVDSLWSFGPRWHGANALILAPAELAAAATHSLAAQVIHAAYVSDESSIELPTS